VTFQFNGGCRGGGPLARSSPVDEFRFWDREGHTYVPALAAIVVKSLCSLRMLPLWEGEATVIERSST